MKTRRILFVLSLMSLGLANGVPKHQALHSSKPAMVADGTDPAPPVPVPPFLATGADAASQSSASLILLADGTDPAPPVPVPPFLATSADVASQASASAILLADGTDPAPPVPVPPFLATSAPVPFVSVV